MSFFAPLLSEFNTDEQNLESRRVRFSTYESIMKEQFHLAYYGRVGYEDSNDMSVLERHTMYRLLVEQKKEEKKATDEAMKKRYGKKKSLRR